MSTQAQIEANRLNAQKSTGPKTAKGKSATAANALKHGLCAERFAIAEQDRQSFETFRTQMVAELNPLGQLETTLAHRIATLAWRLALADRVQTDILLIMTDDVADDYKNVNKNSPSPSFSFPDQKQEYILANAFFRDFSDDKILDRIAAYERRIERSLITTRKELHLLQKLRKETESEPETVIPNECEGSIN